MAVLAQNFLNLADVYKRTDPNGSVANILEVLNDMSQGILEDFMMMECNDGTKHVHTIRTGLPAVSWGALYEGIAQSKSSTQQVTDTTGFVEGLATVDERVLKLAGEKRTAVRYSESLGFLESMAQELVRSFFYHDSATDARKPKGLGARFGVSGNSGAGNQIVKAGGSGSDNTSIWFVTWGENSVFTLYPKGTQAGIQQEDMGRQRVLDADGNPYYVQEEMISAHMGVGVKDWRNVARVANIDVSDLVAGSVDLYKFLRQAYYKLHVRKAGKVKDQMQSGRTVMYCNTQVLEALDALGTNDGATDSFVRLRPMEIEGREVMSYRGIPIRETDAILNTEATVA